MRDDSGSCGHAAGPAPTGRPSQPAARSTTRREREAAEYTFSAVPEATALEDGFPAGALSRIAEHESWRKEVHRPATSTHKWWAKRLGTVFRGILISAVTPAREDALLLYGSAARLDGLTVFDPFAGSGITLVEAIKLGANVVGWDINPVATLVQRQAVQRWDLSELQRAFGQVETACRAEIDRTHRSQSGETVLYYFWVALATCPDCGARTRLFSTPVFAQHAYPRRNPAAQIVCRRCLDIMPGTYDFERTICSNGHEVTRQGMVRAATMTCVNGHATKIIDALGGTPPRSEMYAKLVLGLDGRKRYEAITAFDRELYRQCTALLANTEPKLILPAGELEDGENTRQAIRWGFTSWRQFFNDRQLYSLGLLAAAIRDLDCPPAEREALGALFSGTLEFNNMFCSFKGEGTGAVRHMFSHHVLKPERTPLEAHPWGTPASSGSFSTLFTSRVLRAHAYKTLPSELVISNGKVRRVSGMSQPVEATITESWPPGGMRPGTALLRTGDSARTDLPTGSVDLVVTDPPYMDNVHYSELADFFHAWLRGLAPHAGYPADIATTRTPEEVQSPSPEKFRDTITAIWRECARVLKPSGLLAFTFHQARLSGWTGLMQALSDAGFVVTAIQPIKGEMTTSVTKNGAEPSNLDSILVCRTRLTDGTNPLTSPATAAKIAEQRLVDLLAQGTTVGAGDIKSVVRGHVLACYTANPDGLDLHELALLADELAADTVARVLTASATRERLA